ncbi:CorC-HlyC family protein YbeX [Gammaproteobacteria bacterium]
MKEDRTSNGSSSRSWFERIGQVLIGEPQDHDGLREWLRDAVERGVLDPDSLRMIEGVLHVSEDRVRDIMIPRSHMVVIERDASLEEILPLVVESAHSRFPVIGDSRDEVIGILLAKDLLSHLMPNGETPFNVRDILRSVAFIPESKRLSMLLKEFRASHNHMAIVVDEYGGVAGLVTIEDVLEQIVGDIGDEYDGEEDSYIVPQGKNECIVKALTRISDFNEHFGTEFSDEEFDTVGGLVLNAFGRMPRRGESIEMEGLNFKVLGADIRRLHLLLVTRNSPVLSERDCNKLTE